MIRDICRVLGCEPGDVVDVRPMDAGLTNETLLFTVHGEDYLYRRPGEGTDQIVNRAAEAHALAIARELGLDDTFVHEDPREGWKISRYVEGCRAFDYGRTDDVERALSLIARLHRSGATSPWSFDFHGETQRIAGLLEAGGHDLPADFALLDGPMARLATVMGEMGVAPVLCHNDFYGPNLLVRDDSMRLIDWEYAAMGDPFCDLGNFVAQGSGYDPEEALGLLPVYLGRPATEKEGTHLLAAVAQVGWYWYVWAAYKGAMGDPVGEWADIWHGAALSYLAAAEERLEGHGPEVREGAIWQAS